MENHLRQTLQSYDPEAPLERAGTLPSACYTDPRFQEIERHTVFAGTWQYVGPLDGLQEPGQYRTTEIAGEPIVVIRGEDGTVRAFHNVCRHHAAAVATGETGHCSILRCPYHGWTYSLEGKLRGTPEFDGVADFDRSAHGLAPIRAEEWAGLVFVDLSGQLAPLSETLGEVHERVTAKGPSTLAFHERRTYPLACDWKVYVDNYLDGGYHVPHLHHGLAGVLDHSEYRIENGTRHCLQTSPLRPGPESETSNVRTGQEAFYLWVYPNFMLNAYEGVIDVNLVRPTGPGTCEVVFDYFFAEIDETARKRNEASIAVAERVQDEDVEICESVQRGLSSSVYDVGRLSVRREGGEQLFHRLLHRDLLTAS